MTFIKQEVSSPGGGGGGGANTWNVPGVAFVSDSGNDGAGTVGDGNLPYGTVAAAHAASSKVYILPGTYTESIAMKTETTYFSYPGVVFTGGTLTISENCTNTKWLGYSSFIGNFPPFSIHTFSCLNLVLEFDEIEGSTAAFRPLTASGSNVKLSANRITLTASSGGGITLGLDISGEINVKDFIKANYGVLLLEPTYTFQGDMVIKCPRIECLNLGTAGNNAAYTVALFELK